MGGAWRGWLLVLLLLLSACGGGTQEGSPPDTGELQLPPGFAAEVVARELRGPTALAWGPDGRLYVAQLGGGENAGVGQVLAIARDGGPPTVVLEQLRKPTGLVWRDRDLFIAAGRDVLRALLDAQGRLGPPETLIRDLPSNSRSEGQLTLLPDRRLLFEASGSVGDPESGRVFSWQPADPPAVLGSGLKNAYAHAVDQRTGRIFTTEIGDDPIDGGPPPEEINMLQPGADYGWPRCYADQQPVRSRGADAASCAATAAPLITLPPHSTPTGLVFYDRSDFPAAYRDVLYVALWNGQPPQVLRITLAEQGGQLRGEASPFLRGLQRPIALLPDQDRGLLVLDHAAGTIYRVTSTSAAAMER